MSVIDLTHTIHPDIPVFPGTEPPRIEQANTIAEHGFAERRLTMFTHTGTHMDAPAHILPGRPSLDMPAPDQFMGKACVIDIREKTEVGEKDLAPFRDRIKCCEYVLLRTGWEEKWGTPAYFSGFPTLNISGAVFLTGFGLKGIGVDAISVDPMEDEALSVHRVLLERDILIVENLTNLGRLPETGFTFTALPLKIRDADGSPVRAVAVIP
jgi:kynurenine formamidase